MHQTTKEPYNLERGKKKARTSTVRVAFVRSKRKIVSEFLFFLVFLVFYAGTANQMITNRSLRRVSMGQPSQWWANQTSGVVKMEESVVWVDEGEVKIKSTNLTLYFFQLPVKI
jgi:hypothetical protein